MKSRSQTEVTRTIRRHELKEIVPLADTTIYDMEQRGEFPRRFYLTSRCVVWDLSEVEAWLEERRRASRAKTVTRAPIPDVQLRKIARLIDARVIGSRTVVRGHVVDRSLGRESGLSWPDGQQMVWRP